MDTITLNGHEIEVHAIHEELDGMVRFKFVRNWCNVREAFIPNVTALEFMLQLNAKPATFWDYAEKKPASNSAIRRWVEQGAVRFNGKILKPTQMLDFPILSVVLFPKSDTQYTTIW